jgi:uncharacterized membrane protein
MASAAEESRLHRIFLLTLAIKAADAILELATALALAVVDIEAIQHTAIMLVSKYLVHHPQDRIFAWLADTAANFSLDAKTFAALYLASHGVVKLFLVVGLWRNQAWAYPVSLVVFAAFIAYQLYRFTFTHSAFLIVLTVFDLIVMALVWHEWRYRRERGDFAPAPSL